MFVKVAGDDGGTQHTARVLRRSAGRRGEALPMCSNHVSSYHHLFSYTLVVRGQSIPQWDTGRFLPAQVTKAILGTLI